MIRKSATVVSIGPIDEHQLMLAQILCLAEGFLCPDPKWTLKFYSSLQLALPELRQPTIPIVLCDGDDPTSAWKSLLEEFSLKADPPAVIVTSRRADERLWAEALNLGAYDVLAKPFEAAEVSRVLSHAWLRRTQSTTLRVALGALPVPA